MKQILRIASAALVMLGLFELRDLLGIVAAAVGAAKFHDGWTLYPPEVGHSLFDPSVPAGLMLLAAGVFVGLASLLPFRRQTSLP
ncbi:hypothetical protein [Phenylobacterium montanum]|uniref:Uncharacterized protein n=1 Tax=Phenylobacterium montanum TaxID=2823693 RepID=A0A975ITD9_9CAUL|nr:hypothetical protein [Caulobacter sp. S6]QUD86688.1 hypothetical protein KCG34_16605 [Caulobacter sp. S6]